MYARCKCHVAIDTGVKQTKRTIFSVRYFSGIEIVIAFKCIFEETMPKLSVNFGDRISQDLHKNQYPCPVCNFGLLHHNTVTNVGQICR